MNAAQHTLRNYNNFLSYQKYKRQTKISQLCELHFEFEKLIFCSEELQTVVKNT